MAQANRLGKRKIDKLAKPGVYGDGNTLYLRVRDTGSKRWVQIVHIEGKRYERGLGGYPIVSLADARAIAFDNRRKAKLGDNPFVAKRVETTVPTFLDGLEAVIAIKRPSWRNRKSEAQWRSSLTNYAKPLHKMPVDSIETADVLDVVEPIWHSKRETANRVKQRIGEIMDWSIAKGYRADNPVAAVNAVLPRNGKSKRHHRALPWQEVPKAIKTIEKTDADLATKLAFEFLVLTAARSGEVRLAKWHEIDIGKEIWTLSDKRMKAGVEHIVPLSKQAIKCLEAAGDAYGIEDDDWVFPAQRGKAISDGTISKLLRDHGVKAVPHGFRSSFRD